MSIDDLRADRTMRGRGAFLWGGLRAPGAKAAAVLLIAMMPAPARCGLCPGPDVSPAVQASAELFGTGSETLSGPGAQIGMAAFGAAVLISVLLLYHRVRFRRRAIGAIQQALMLAEKGERSPEVLSVSAELGHEAGAWNKLLEEKQELQKQMTLECARESLGASQRGESELGAACDVMSQGLILVDENLIARYANGAAAVLLQVERDAIVGGDITEVIKHENVVEAIRAAAIGPVHKRAIVEVQNTPPHRAGVFRFIVRPVRREDSGVAMIIIDDITQQRVAQESRDAFLAQAAHELRTPLTNIVLSVETGLEEGQKNPAALAGSLNVINQEARRLERIVADILSISQIEAGSFKITRDDVRLEVLFEQIQADYEAQAKEKGIDLMFDLPPKLPVIQADRDKVALALHNLLGNALKYTPTGGQVTVIAEVRDDQVTIEVTDTGIGISQSDTTRIFERFYRAQDRRVAETTGSGLGLALAREVVRLHGGDITVDSEVDKGSTFAMTLPLSRDVA